MLMLDRGASGTQHVSWGQAIDATIAAYLKVASQEQYHYILPDKARSALAEERALLRPLIDELVRRNTTYRAFITDGFTEIRALERVADFVCDDGQRDADRVVRGREDALARVVSGGVNALRDGNVLSRVLRAGKKLTVQYARGTAALLRVLPADTFGDAPKAADKLDGGAALLGGYLKDEEAIEAQRVSLRAAVRGACAALREQLEQMNGRLRTHLSDAFIDSLYPQLADKGRKIVDDIVDDSGEDPEPPGDAPTP